MKQELPSPAPWINSRYNPRVGWPEPEPEPDMAEDDWLLDEVTRLSDQADTALTAALFFGSLLILVFLVELTMWAGGLLLIMH